MTPRRERLFEWAAIAALLAAGAAAGVAWDAAVEAWKRPWLPRTYQEVWAAPDEEARFVPRPGVYPPFLGVDLRFDRLGLRGPDRDRVDVLALGDSCTFGVKVPEADTYAGVMTSRGVVTANGGVPGYNTYLALARLRRSGLLSLKPRVVVLYFGWNDHWTVPATERAFARLRRAGWPLGLGSLLLRAQQALYTPRYWAGRLRRVPQVPLVDYEDNLQALIALARGAGARVVLVTAASQPERMESYFPEVADDYRRYHAVYCEATRRVAARTGARLVDFAAAVQRLSPEERAALFVDPVHLSAEGHRRLARELLDAARQLGVAPRRGRAPA